MTARILAFPAARVFRDEEQRENFSGFYLAAQQQMPDKDHEEVLELAKLGERIGASFDKVRRDRRKAEEERTLQELANCIADRVRTQNGKKRGRKPKGGAK